MNAPHIREAPAPTKTALLVVSGTALLALVLFGSVPGHGRWTSDLGNAAHGPVFMLVALITLALLRTRTNRPAAVYLEYAVAVIVAVLLGVFVEILQHFTGRDAELRDLLGDAVGAIAAVSLSIALDRKSKVNAPTRTVRMTALAVAACACVVMVGPLFLTAGAYLYRFRSFPTIADFSSPFSTYFLRIHSSVEVERAVLPREFLSVTEDTRGLRARMTDDKWWEILVVEPAPDWRNFDQLAFDLANPTDALVRVKLRIRDQNYRSVSDGGYVTELEVAPRSRQKIGIPLEYLIAANEQQRVDLSRVHHIILSSSALNRGREFYLIRVWLE